MRSRASGAARLDAPSCCFCEGALALSELRRFPCCRFAPSLDVRRRIARERVPTTGAAAPIVRGERQPPNVSVEGKY
jgi:hypothetical protein